MRPSGTMRELRAASVPSTTPSWVMMPARNISASASMMPEPQTPVTPSRRVASAKPGSSDHLSRADDLEARLERLGVDAHPLDGAGCGALAAGDLRALEGGAGRAGAGEQPLPVAQHDLGIGADIDDQRHLVDMMRGFRQDHAGGVGADMAGDAGQHEDPGVGMER